MCEQVSPRVVLVTGTDLQALYQTILPTVQQEYAAMYPTLVRVMGLLVAGLQMLVMAVLMSMARCYCCSNSCAKQQGRGWTCLAPLF